MVVISCNSDEHQQSEMILIRMIVVITMVMTVVTASMKDFINEDAMLASEDEEVVREGLW